MGDVQISAAATVAAAVIAVVGSIAAVALSGLLQRRLLRAQLSGQAADRRLQWERENAQSESAAKAAACATFDAAVVRALGRLQRVMDPADRPALRRRLLGRNWPQLWEENLLEAAFGIALPYSTLRFAADEPVLVAAEEVMKALDDVVSAMSSVPTPLPPSPLYLVRWSARRRWRQDIQVRTKTLQSARRKLISAVDASRDRR